MKKARHKSTVAIVFILVFISDAYSRYYESPELASFDFPKNEVGINIAPFLPFLYTKGGLYRSNYLTFLQSLRYKRQIANNNILRFQFDYSPTVFDRYSQNAWLFFPYGMHNSIVRQYDSTQIQITRNLESHYFGLSVGLEKQFYFRRFINSVGLDISIGADFVTLESRLDSVRIIPVIVPTPYTIEYLDEKVISCTNIISGIYLIYELSYPIYRRLYISGQVGLGLNHVYGKDMQIPESELDVIETYSSRFFFQSKMKNNICLKYLF